MNLGEKLRELRRDQNLTQPELSEAIGIEQSYLSKLENGKYTPSSDVFRRILEVLGLSIADFVEGLDHRSRLQLRQIPEVANHFDGQKRLIIGNRRRWLLGSVASLALGVALIYGGSAQLFVPGVVYQYKSHGVVLEGEPKELFAVLGHQPSINPFISRSSGEIMAEQRASLQERIDEEFLSTRYYRGEVFNVPIAGGSRTYYRTDREAIDSRANKAAAFVGIVLLTLGATGIALEKKLAYYQ